MGVPMQLKATGANVEKSSPKGEKPIPSNGTTSADDVVNAGPVGRLADGGGAGRHQSEDSDLGDRVDGSR